VRPSDDAVAALSDLAADCERSQQRHIHHRC
jgi:hypothetical protein